MALDTECDLIFGASSDNHRQQITAVRNDLLAEHSGLSIGEVQNAFRHRNPLRHLMNKNRRHGYAITEAKDNAFTNKKLQKPFQFLSDPDRPLISPIRWLNGKRIIFRNPRRKSFFYGLTIVLLTVAIGLYTAINHSLPAPSSEQVSLFLEYSRQASWRLPIVCLIYLIGGVLFFPATLISLAVSAIFGPLWGPIYGLIGALFSTIFMVLTGRILGRRSLRVVGGVNVEVVSNKISHSNIMDVIAIRFMPIAPFSLVNLVAGIASVSFLPFILGTFIGFFPSMFAKGLVGDAIMTVYLHPTFQSLTYVVCSVFLWILLLFISQRFAKYYQRQKIDQ